MQCFMASQMRMTYTLTLMNFIEQYSFDSLDSCENKWIDKLNAHTKLMLSAEILQQLNLFQLVMLYHPVSRTRVTYHNENNLH